MILMSFLKNHSPYVKKEIKSEVSIIYQHENACPFFCLFCLSLNFDHYLLSSYKLSFCIFNPYAVLFQWRFNEVDASRRNPVTHWRSPLCSFYGRNVSDQTLICDTLSMEAETEFRMTYSTRGCQRGFLC